MEDIQEVVIQEMKHIVHTDADGYVQILELTTKEEGIVVPTEVFESRDLICYKYVNGEFIFDEEKKARLDSERLIEEPTQLDRIESQVLFTALMTDTLLED